RGHGKTNGLKVHVLEYGGEGGAASKPAGAVAEAVTAAPAPAVEQKSYLSRVLAAINKAANATELSSAVPQQMMSNPIVMEALAARRKVLLKGTGVEGQGTSEKKEAAPAKTKAVEGTTVAETRTPAKLLETVNGIGRATAIKLVAAGVHTVAELAASDAAALAAKSGVNKALLARAIDGLNKLNRIKSS
ncbi:MAG: DUF4332 domain-containing protein, partial [Gammaproteobacteria bacterium]|nr:DUF4332 domain-containing protein [Gammaproteobacteria bacterium]